jgi:hypothetical protein
MTPEDTPETDADEAEPQLLICYSCGETMHSFESYDGAPVPPIDDPDLSPTERLEKDPQAGQPVWRCWQCGNYRHGPPPGSELTPENKALYKPQTPLETTTLNAILSIYDNEGFNREHVVEIVQDDHDASAAEIKDALETVLGRGTSDHEAIQSQPMTLLEREVLDTMRTLADGESVNQEQLIASVQDDHDVSVDDIENAIERLLLHGKCYKYDDTTITLQ